MSEPGSRFSIRKANLPAISAVAAIAPATTTPAAMTTTVAAAAAAEPASAATTATTFRLGTRFIDNEIPPAEILSVQRINRAVRFFVIPNFDEGKTTRLSRKTVSNQIYRGGVTTGLNEVLV